MPYPFGQRGKVFLRLESTLNFEIDNRLAIAITVMSQWLVAPLLHKAMHFCSTFFLKKNNNIFVVLALSTVLTLWYVLKIIQNPIATKL